jgi:hypothetical protein
VGCRARGDGGARVVHGCKSGCRCGCGFWDRNVSCSWCFCFTSLTVGRIRYPR